MMADDSDDPRLGTVIAGYRIEERIGRGGMGVVYRAEHINLQRRAAIKIIAPDLAESSGFRERFTREARIAAALQHPNIVTVYDAGEVDGLLYLAMQYIKGEDLVGGADARGRLRPYRAIDVCRQVASALDAAHAMGLIHRDVKPANVLIEGRTAFLTDFGLTKRLEGTHAQITRVGDVVGTIHYVAPEQIEGRKVSARSDVYSLGCLLYHCLSGQVPFARETDVAVIYAHLSEEPTKLVDAAARPARRARRRRGQGDGQVARPAVPELRRHDLGRPRGARRRRPARATRRRRGTAPASAPRSRTPTPEVRDAAAAARRPRVLLGGLDDHTSAVARVALGNHVDVLEAPTPATTVDRAREERPDLVIVDWAGAGARGSPTCAPTRSRATPRCCCSSTTGRARAARSPPRAPTSAWPRRSRRCSCRSSSGACSAPRSSAGDRVVAVLAGGRGRRMGAPKALAELGGAPLIARPLAAAAAAGLDAVVVAKAGTRCRRSPCPCGTSPRARAPAARGRDRARARRRPVVAVAATCRSSRPSCSRAWRPAQAAVRDGDSRRSRPATTRRAARAAGALAPRRRLRRWPRSTRRRSRSTGTRSRA